MNRRNALGQIAAFGALAAIATPARAAAPHARTPGQNEGPYYPLEKPGDRDANLLKIGPDGAMAKGEPLALSGRVLGLDGKPLPGVRVEIWQADHQGYYNHPYAPGKDAVDPLFQGYGEVTTDSAGRYSFLTLVPVRYGFRAPHIHVKIKRPGHNVLTTQIYRRGHPENKLDNLLKSISATERAQLMMDLRPVALQGGLKGQKAAFDFVV